MSKERLASRSDTDAEYVDRLELRITRPEGASHPTANTGDMIDFMQKYPDCEVQIVLATDERVYLVALPPDEPEYMI